MTEPIEDMAAHHDMLWKWQRLKLIEREPEKARDEKEAEELRRELFCPPHDWEAPGSWGVIIGVSRCRRCGELSRREMFGT